MQLHQHVWNDGVASITEEGDAPHVGAHVASSSDDGFTTECDFASSGVEEDFATCIVRYGYRDEIVDDGGCSMVLSCSFWPFIEEQLESFYGEHASTCHVIIQISDAHIV